MPQSTPVFGMGMFIQSRGYILRFGFYERAQLNFALSLRRKFGLVKFVRIFRRDLRDLWRKLNAFYLLKCSRPSEPEAGHFTF